MDIKKLPKRKEVKQTESPIEDILLQAFYQYQLFPELQYEIGNCRADFFFKELNLVVEADGRAYHSTPEQIERDKKRDLFIKSKGYKILRFFGNEIVRDPSIICKRIIEEYYVEKGKEVVERKPVFFGFGTPEMTHDEFREQWEIKKSGCGAYL